MEIGRQINLLRKKQKISSKKLVEGLCSERTLNYIEAGEELPDKMLADLLIQRLGKSPDKLELIISKEVYQLERMQDIFEEALERGNRKRAIYLLENYAEIAPKSNAYKMFYCRSMAYLAFRLDHNLAEAQEWIKKALDITLPCWQEKSLGEYLVSTMEMENLLAYAKLRLWEGTETGLRAAETLLMSCKTYIDERILDGEEHAKVYCKCTDLLAEIYLKQGHLFNVGAMCENAFEELRNFGILYYMQPLLDKLVLCPDDCLSVETNRMYRIYRDVINNVYQRYEEDWHFKDSVFKNCCQRTYYMDYELIRGERLARGITQEQLIEGIYENPESLSRVESGKSSPRNKTFVQLFERLGIQKGRYNTFIATESFDVLEMKDKIDVLTSRKMYEEAEVRLRELKSILDLEIMENNRVVQGLELTLQNMLNKISANELLEKMLALLQETYLFKAAEEIRVPLDREVYLLNQIAIILRKLGQKGKVESVYAMVLKTMKNSVIKIPYRFRTYSTVATNLAKQSCSASLAKKNIKYALQCGKLRAIHMNYMTEICASMDNPANHTTCRILLEEAYYICKLIHNESDKKGINLYYEKQYGQKICEK